jgi:hypothetical protein
MQLSEHTKAELKKVELHTGLSVLSAGSGFKYQDTATGRPVSPRLYQERYLHRLGCKLESGPVPGRRCEASPQQQPDLSNCIAQEEAPVASPQHSSSSSSSSDPIGATPPLLPPSPVDRTVLDLEGNQSEMSAPSHGADGASVLPQERCVPDSPLAPKSAPRHDPNSSSGHTNTDEQTAAANAYALDLLPPLVELPAPVNAADQVLQTNLQAHLRQSERELHAAFDKALAEFEQKRTRALAQYQTQRERCRGDGR